MNNEKKDIRVKMEDRYIVVQGHSDKIRHLKDKRLKKYLHVLSSGWWVLVGKYVDIEPILEEHNLLKNSRRSSEKYVTIAAATYYTSDLNNLIHAVIDTSIGKVIRDDRSLLEYSERYTVDTSIDDIDWLNSYGVTVIKVTPLDNAITGVIIGSGGYRARLISRILPFKTKLVVRKYIPGLEGIH
jgi:hypothetical protein